MSSANTMVLLPQWLTKEKDTHGYTNAPEYMGLVIMFLIHFNLGYHVLNISAHWSLVVIESCGILLHWMNVGERIASLFKNAWHTLNYYVDGPNVIQRFYKTVGGFGSLTSTASRINDLQGSPYTVTTPGHKTLFLSSSAHVRELSDAPETHLSLHSVAREVCDFRCLSYNLFGKQKSCRCSIPSLPCTTSRCMMKQRQTEAYIPESFAHF